MNLDELEEAHKIVNAHDEWFDRDELGRCWGLINRAFPALLALARDGERHRWMRDRVYADKDTAGTYIKFPNIYSGTDEFMKGSVAGHLDAFIDAMKERT